MDKKESLEYYDNLLEKILSNNELCISNHECIHYTLESTKTKRNLARIIEKNPNTSEWVSLSETNIKVDYLFNENNKPIGFIIQLKVYPDIFKNMDVDLISKCLWQVACEYQLSSKKWKENFSENYILLKETTGSIFYMDTIRVYDPKYSNTSKITGKELIESDKILIPTIWLSINKKFHKNFFKSLDNYTKELKIQNTHLFN